MANLEAQPEWTSVRQLETHELARGGLNGNMNEQAKALVARTEYLNLEKAGKSEIVQGIFEFSTFAEFEQNKATLPNNCTVVINEENTIGGDWAIGNNTWNGSILKKSEYDPTQKMKLYSDNVGEKIKNEVSGSLTEFEFYLRNNDIVPVLVGDNGAVVLGYSKSKNILVGLGVEKKDFFDTYSEVANTEIYNGESQLLPLITGSNGEIVLAYSKNENVLVGLGFEKKDFFNAYAEIAQTEIYAGSEDNLIPLITGSNGGIILGFSPTENKLVGLFDQNEKLVELTDLNQFLFYGQSLSLGGQGTPAISTSQPQQNLTLTGGSHPTGFTSLVPLFENNSESPCSGAANFASVLARIQNGIEHSIVSSTAGVSDAPLHTLVKGTNAYTNMLKQITAVKNFKGESSHSVKAFGWLQGEANLRDLIAMDTYEQDLKAHFENMQNDAVAITGQSIKPKIITYQLSTRIGLSDVVCKTHLNLCKQKITAIATPTYHLDYVADGVHLTNVGYKWIGAYFGRAYKQWVVDNKHPDYLEPLSAELVSNKVILTFKVPQSPLVLDTTNLAITTDHGFLVKSAGSKLTITNIVAKENTLEISLSEVPSLQNLVVRYGLDYMASSKYIRDGKSGNLRDSTTETVIINGSEKPLFHVSPHFELKVNSGEI